MADDFAQGKTGIAPDGSLRIPDFLLDAMLWKPGQQVLLEHNDDGLLATRPKCPEDAR